MTDTPWLTVEQASSRLQVSKKTLYRAVAERKLRAARIGGKRALRFLPEWVDAYAIATAAVVEVAR
jgi:excisionase family DNA binding protein